MSEHDSKSMVVIEAELTDEEQRLDNMIKVSRARFNDLRDKLEANDKAAIQTEIEMLPLLADLKNEMMALNRELREKTDEYNQLLGNEQTPPPPPPKPEVETVQTKAKEKPPERCRSIFRQISAICHPDRTKNPLLHQIMVLANSHRKDHSVLWALLNQAVEIAKSGEGVEAAVAPVMVKLIDRASAKRQEYEHLIAEVDRLQRELASQSQSQTVRMAKTWVASDARNREHMVAEAGRQMQTNIATIRAQVQQVQMMMNLVRNSSVPKYQPPSGSQAPSGAAEDLLSKLWRSMDL